MSEFDIRDFPRKLETFYREDLAEASKTGRHKCFVDAIKKLIAGIIFFSENLQIFGFFLHFQSFRSFNSTLKLLPLWYVCILRTLKFSICF